MIGVLALVILLGIWFSGCALVQAQTYRDLSPEQIRAINETGGQVYSCLSFGGPPPVGKTVFIVVPKGQPLPVTFGSNCEVIPALTLAR